MSLINKIKYRSKLKRYFKKIEDFLDDGYYTVIDKQILKVKKSECPFYRRFVVKSKNIKAANYNCGSLFFTKYKSGFLTEQKAFYFINKKDRYDTYKNNYNLYKDKLVYPSIKLEFCDKRMLVIAPMVNGSLIKDQSHFEIFMNKLFEFASKSQYEMKDDAASKTTIKLPWYVQHGDCKDANIIWDDKSDSFTMIDLEAIDLYPPLYDVFYYLFITKKNESISVLNSDKFKKQILGFYTPFLDSVPKNIVDITLANYAFYTAFKVTRGIELYEYEFYLFWRKYDSFDKYPITQRVLKEYENKLKEYNIK